MCLQGIEGGRALRIELTRRFRGPFVVVGVCLSPVLLLDVPMGHVHVLDRCMVVLMAMSGEQVSPVLAAM